MRVYHMGYRKEHQAMKKAMNALERLLERGGIRKDIVLLVLSGVAVICSLAGVRPFGGDPAWAAHCFGGGDRAGHGL